MAVSKNKLLQLMMLMIITMYAFNSKAIYAMEKKTVMDKPYYSLEISLEGAKYDLSINDINLLKDKKPSSMRVTLPLNHFLLNGDNEISLKLTHVEIPDVPDGYDISVSGKIALKVRQSGTPEETDKLISLIAFKGYLDKKIDFKAYLTDSIGGIKLDSKQNFAYVENGDVNVSRVTEDYDENTKTLSLSQKITLPFLHEWKWSSSNVISDDESSFESLWSEYEKLWQALASKKTNEIDALFEERNEELAKAFYTTSKEMMNKLGLQELVNNEGLKLYELHKKHSHIEVYAHGRLARILFWDDGPILFFNHKDGTGAVNVPVVFRWQNDQWIICR